MIDLSRTPLTYLITKGDATAERFEANSKDILSVVANAVNTGISMVQIREKNITIKQLFQLARDAATLVSGSQTKLLINSRADVAIAAGADGVHLPEDGVPVAAVRSIFPTPFLIGASVHSHEAACTAKNDGADFVLFGPVFDTPGKQGVGIEPLRETCLALGDFPVLAVGGIDASNKASVLEGGACGYAAIRYLNDDLQ